MNPHYNPQIRLIEQNWVGSLQSFFEQNRPFLSDDAIAQIARDLSQNGACAFDAGSKVLFHFEVTK